MSGRAKNKAVLPKSAALTFGQIKRNMGNVSEVENLPYFQLTFQFNPRPAHVVGALVGNHSLFAWHPLDCVGANLRLVALSLFAIHIYRAAGTQPRFWGMLIKMFSIDKKRTWSSDTVTLHWTLSSPSEGTSRDGLDGRHVSLWGSWLAKHGMGSR